MRQSLNQLVFSYIFALSAAYITNGVAQTQFAKQMELPVFWYALLAALPMIGSLMQLPSSIVANLLGRRKLIVIVMGVFDRLLWGGVAAIPWFFPAGPWRWGGFLVSMALLHLTVNIAAPLQNSWMADIVPERIRGRFFGRMRQVGQLAAFVLIYLVGWFLDYGESGGTRQFITILSLLFTVSALFGLIEVLLLTPIPDPLNTKAHVQIKIRELLAGPLRDKAFLRFLGFNCSATFANLFLTSYATLYLIDVVKLSNRTINLILLVLPMVLTIPSYAIWGRFIDRVGKRPALILSMICIAPAGLTYALMQPEHWVLPYLGQLLVSACFCGFEIVMIAWLMSFGQSKDGKVQGSHYIALSSILNGLVGLGTGVLVGFLVSLIGKDWHGSFLGLPMTFHRVLLLLSVLLRIGTMGWLITWSDPNAVTVTQALRQAPGTVANSLRQQAGAPIRLLSRLRRPAAS